MDSVVEKSNKYPSATLMLDIIMKEYEFESNRKNSIESRAGILLTLVGALLTIIPTFFSLSKYSKLEIKTVKDIIFPGIAILLFLLTLVLLSFSIIYFVKSLSTKNYERLSYTGFNKDNASALESEVALCIMCEYAKSIKINIEANNDKVNKFNSAIFFLKYALILYASMFIITQFI